MSPAKRPSSILRNISLSIPVGSRLAVVGGNGAGKSTFIKLLLGLYPIGEGSVSILGKAVPSVESRAQLAYLADVPAPFGYLTGREYLSLYGELEGLKGKALLEKVNHGLTNAGLIHVADVSTDRYSKGMRQRLEIERVLLNKRQILILDEPMTGLDVESQMSLKYRLRKLSDEKVSMVITSHEPSILESICTHIALLKSGELVTFGPVGELLTEKGWEIIFSESVPSDEKFPEGATISQSRKSVLLKTLQDAESVLEKHAHNGQVLSFGTAIKGIEDLLGEVAEQ
jgi:ABC-2 type transport system ATP-binding protein